LHGYPNYPCVVAAQGAALRAFDMSPRHHGGAVPGASPRRVSPCARSTCHHGGAVSGGREWESTQQRLAASAHKPRASANRA